MPPRAQPPGPQVTTTTLLNATPYNLNSCAPPAFVNNAEYHGEDANQPTGTDSSKGRSMTTRAPTPAAVTTRATAVPTTAIANATIATADTTMALSERTTRLHQLVRESELGRPERLVVGDR